MSWSARIEHVDGGLAIQFAEPLSRLTMTSDVAAHFASLLAIEARHRLVGVVRTLEAENKQNGVTVDDDDHVLMCTCDSCLNGDHDHA